MPGAALAVLGQTVQVLNQSNKVVSSVSSPSLLRHDLLSLPYLADLWKCRADTF